MWGNIPRRCSPAQVYLLGLNDPRKRSLLYVSGFWQGGIWHTLKSLRVDFMRKSAQRSAFFQGIVVGVSGVGSVPPPLPWPSFFDVSCVMPVIGSDFGALWSPLVFRRFLSPFVWGQSDFVRPLWPQFGLFGLIFLVLLTDRWTRRALLVLFSCPSPSSEGLAAL